MQTSPLLLEKSEGKNMKLLYCNCKKPNEKLKFAQGGPKMSESFVEMKSEVFPVKILPKLFPSTELNLL